MQNIEMSAQLFKKDITTNSSYDKVLQNGLLFNALRKNKPVDKKIIKVQKHLENGADINSGDANDKHNTPLHISVIKGELQIIQLLLERGALTDKRNLDGQTPMDIAQESNTPIRQEIINILKLYHTDSIHFVVNNTNSENICSENTQISFVNEIHKTTETGPDISAIKAVNQQILFKKRPGTSGMGGHLYESKLLSLILLRALHDEDVIKFYLGTNVEGVGDFDDIIFKFNSRVSEKSNIIFVQAKHKDVSGKIKLTIKEVLNENGNFSFLKYFDSYMSIRRKLMLNHDDVIFGGYNKDVECHFLIYTPAEENFVKKKYVAETSSFNKIRNLISAGSKGRVFQFEYDDNDIHTILQTVTTSRIKLLAKTLMKFILKGNHSNMMADDLIKTYHVLLAQHVIQIYDSNSSNTSYVIARFRNKFLESRDCILSVFKDTIIKEVINKSPNKEKNQIHDIVKSLSFKLPNNFGNSNLDIGGDRNKKERRLDYIRTKLQQLLNLADENSIIRVDDGMVGPGKLLQYNDFEKYRLGGLVGSLLILDNNTELLKFNNESQLLPENVKELYKQLKIGVNNEFVFEKYRFDINVIGFPKLLISVRKHDIQVIKDFLNSLTFYTDQAQEDLVENILKKEIDELYSVKEKKSSALFRVKADAIFLKVHHDVQNWWKKQNMTPYLTEQCNFFDQAKEEIFNWSLVSVMNFTCTKKIKNSGIEFNIDAVKSLKLHQFLINSNEIILNLITTNIVLTSIKLYQYLQHNYNKDYIFIDLDFTMENNCLETIFNELKETNFKLLIILLNTHEALENLYNLLKTPLERVIVITKWDLKELMANKLLVTFAKQVDNTNNMSNLSIQSIDHLLKDKEIAFQGIDIPLNIFLDKESLSFIDSDVLLKIANNEKIYIGKPLTNLVYDEVKDYYTHRNITRHIELKLVELGTENFTVITTDHAKDAPKTNQDVILISDKEDTFNHICDEYKTHNIHWFEMDGEYYIWRKSRGSLNKLKKYVNRNCDILYSHELKTLRDISDDIVILSADPGMGKTTILTHLAVQTKITSPRLWIIKINLLDFKNIFNEWKENSTEISIKELMQFMYAGTSLRLYTKENDEIIRNYKELAEIFNVILINDNDTILDIKNENISSFDTLDIAEAKLLNNMYNKQQIVLLLDGFDEISPDYTNEVLKLVEIIKISKVRQLWIATRPYNILNQLEDQLCTFSYTLNPLSQPDQKNFLELLWNKILQREQSANFGLFQINHLSDEILRRINDKEKSFTSIPLHTYMIVEILQDYLKHNYDTSVPILAENYLDNFKQNCNLITLYKHFADIKFWKIRFGEKKPLIPFYDPDIKNIVEEVHLEFIQIHKNLAAHFLLDKNVSGLFVEDDMRKINAVIEKIKSGGEKTGIINGIVGHEPQFVHFTFAEYFATEYICDRLKSSTCTADIWIYLFNVVLKQEKSGIRRFFECKLGIDEDLANLSSVKIHKKEVFEVLLTQRFTYDTTLYVAIYEFCDKIALFVLYSLKTVLNKDNLDEFIEYIVKRCVFSCAMCSAVNYRCKDIINCILQIVKHIDSDKVIKLFKCCDFPAYSPLNLALCFSQFDSDRNTLDLLLSNIDSADQIFEVFTMGEEPRTRWNIPYTSLHILTMNNLSIECVSKYLVKLSNEQRMQIFSAVGVCSRLAAHLAAFNSDFNYFDIMEELLDKNQFRQICATVDNLGRTPILCFPRTSSNREKLNALIKKLSIL